LTILVTGGAGFIGMHACLRLLERGDEVVAIDNLDPYYDVSLKQARLEQLASHAKFTFHAADVCDRPALKAIFEQHRPQRVIHLAAQVGVRNSVTNPAAYLQTNLVGFGNVLEQAQLASVEHLVYASSSSVYGSNARLPFAESSNVDHPLSLYAATKKANELMAHAYSHLHRLPVTGLRFFTVYGPWGRPDMAPFLFAKAIMDGRPIDVFNNGDMLRDFTYIDDAVDCVLSLCDRIAQPEPRFDRLQPDPAASDAPYRVFNIGNSQPVPLLEFIATLETALSRKAIKNFLPMQPGDVCATAADTRALEAWTGLRPHTALAEGVRRFAAWYLGHDPVNGWKAIAS
jgi:UDP-glucuronate 4-epimerase